MSQHIDKAALFRSLGAAIYGPQWQSPLARELSISLRTIQRWTAGEISPPGPVWMEILRLFRDHAEHCAELCNQIGRAGWPELTGLGPIPAPRTSWRDH